MAITALPITRTIIVGAGASFPYGLPLASDLLEQSVARVSKLKARATKGIKEHYRVDETYLSNGNQLDLATIRGMGGAQNLDMVTTTFKERLVAQNLDDFVRDHPSLTDAVSMLILISLFQKIYSYEDYVWKLQSSFHKGGLASDKDWMRGLVGVLRPTAVAGKKLAIISFNYDGLLERAMRLYWDGAERKYPALNDCIEFVYPHGKIAELPDQIPDAVFYLSQQSKNIRLGENKDEVARARAKEIIAASTRIYAAGFSFSSTNMDLLGIDRQKLSSGFYVQNFDFKDKRLSRILDDAGVHPNCRDEGDMTSLIRHGFFEQ